MTRIVSVVALCLSFTVGCSSGGSTGGGGDSDVTAAADTGAATDTDAGATPDIEPQADDTDPPTPGTCDDDQVVPTLDPAYKAAILLVDPYLLEPQPPNGWLKEDNFVVVGPNPERTRNQLFVMLPGSGASPERGEKLVGIASFAGYHAIGLPFANKQSVSGLCGPTADPSICHGQVIHERIYGEDTSPLIAVDVPNSIVGRLVLVLHNLAQKNPNGGWEQYLNGTQIQWEKIAISGASQGGKTATYISRDQLVARAVLLNAMGSAFQGDGGGVDIAPWSQEPRVTPPERVYGIWHKGESANFYAHVLLTSYGVDAFGGVVDVDDMSPPYDCSHMLRTALEPGANNPEASSGQCNEHSSVGADDCVALDGNGDPILAPVYLYMMTWETAP